MFQKLDYLQTKTFHSQLNKQLSKMLGKILILLAIFHQTNSLNAPISGSFSNEGHIILQNHLAHLVLDIRLEKLEESIHTLEKSFKEFNVSEQRLKEKLPEIELVNIILGSEVENIRKDFNDIKAFFATNDKPSNQHQTTTKRPTLLNTNNDQQEGTIIIGNAINPTEDNNSNTSQTLRKKRTTTLKSLDNNIQNTPINDNRDTNESDKETNTEINEVVDTTTEPPQITTESTTQITVTPETDTENYMTDTEILTEPPDTNEEITNDQDTTEEITVDDQDTNNETTDDNKEIGITFTENPSIHTDMNQTPHTQTNTTAIPTGTSTQNSPTDLPETSVNIGPEIPHTEMETNTQSTTTDTARTETLSTDTTEMLYFKLNQLLKNKTLNPDLETITIEGQKIRLKPKNKPRNNDRMELTPWKVIDHTLTTKTPHDIVTSRPQSDLTSNTIEIDDKFTDNSNQNTHHRIVKRQAAAIAGLSAIVGFGGGIALTRYLDNKQLTRIEKKLQNLRDADDEIIHHLQHNDENIKINRDSISNTARILVLC